MMIQRRLILGFFDTIAEAQQAVQLLLARGFTDETVELSTPASPITGNAGECLPLLTQSGRSSGRFFSTLFESRTEMRSRNPTLISVQTQSATEASQVVDLLNKAGATDKDIVLM